MPRGGKRAGAGKKKGTKHPRTLERLTALDLFRKRAEAELDPLITAQLETAKGLFHFLAKTPAGYVRVTDPTIMAKCLQSGESFYRIAVKDPDVRALKDTFDRVLGTPVQQVAQTVTQSGTIQVVHKHLPADA